MKNKKLRNDIILVLALIAAAAAAWGVIEIAGKEGAYASVEIDGAETARDPLDTDTETVIGNRGGSYNLLVIKDGKASVTEASCPDGICVNHRAISRTGETIVCLPNRVVVRIVGADAEAPDVVQ